MPALRIAEDIAEDDAADELLGRDPLAVLLAVLLDHAVRAGSGLA